MEVAYHSKLLDLEQRQIYPVPLSQLRIILLVRERDILNRSAKSFSPKSSRNLINNNKNSSLLWIFLAGPILFGNLQNCRFNLFEVKETTRHLLRINGTIIINLLHQYNTHNLLMFSITVNQVEVCSYTLI